MRARRRAADLVGRLGSGLNSVDRRSSDSLHAFCPHLSTCSSPALPTVVRLLLHETVVRLNVNGTFSQPKKKEKRKVVSVGAPLFYNFLRIDRINKRSNTRPIADGLERKKERRKKASSYTTISGRLNTNHSRSVQSAAVGQFFSSAASSSAVIPSSHWPFLVSLVSSGWGTLQVSFLRRANDPINHSVLTRSSCVID